MVPPPRVVQFQTTDWKSNVTGALQTYSDDLTKLLAQNPKFTLDDFVRYSGLPNKGLGWHVGALAVADSVAKDLRGMTGQKLHDFLQQQLQQAIATTNKIAQGGPGKEGFGGDEIIDTQERVELSQKSPVASAILENVVASFEQPEPYIRW